jgi:hypothetical protein
MLKAPIPALDILNILASAERVNLPLMFQKLLNPNLLHVLKKLAVCATLLKLYLNFTITA